MQRSTVTIRNMALPAGVHNLKCKELYMDAQEDMHMNDYNKITALYSRLSVGDEDRDGGESNSIQNQDFICQGEFLQFSIKMISGRQIYFCRP